MKQRSAPPDLGTLSSLGLGPDAVLMSEPKLFVDRRFLGGLIAELEEELGEEGARTALFQIGLLHGLRDASRLVTGDFLTTPSSARSRVTPLVLSLGPRDTNGGGIDIPGAWPERYEAQARLASVGPTAHASCALSAGYTSGWLSGTLDADLLAIETECAARGDERCHFVTRELAVWRALEDPHALPLLEAVPFDLFRDISSHEPNRPVESHGDFDAEAPVVHIWGPVMVLPLTTVDDALRTVEMLSRDPSTCSVKVVVFDLRDRLVDDGFDAAGVESILETVESWGAEVILTGVSPLSEPVVAELETAHLLVRKDLPEAIAAGFQIAEAQRHVV